MPDIELRDIGISKSEAWQVARKPFWRARLAPPASLGDCHAILRSVIGERQRG